MNANIPERLLTQLRTRLGLDEDIAGPAALASAVKHQMAAGRIDSLEDYFERVSTDEKLFEALTEELLVPESWFFRDGKPFVWLAEWVRTVWSVSGGGRTLRVLSVPSAAGQEPYSIAMILLEAGLDPEQFVVESGDLSERSLALARTAVYKKYAFRGEREDLRERYFDTADGVTFSLKPEVCERVRFRRCNLIAPDFFTGEGFFDILFCRNVMIYFTATARQQALANLERCLHPEGLLFMGHADALLSLSDRFVSRGPGGAFCYARGLRPQSAARPAAESVARLFPTGRRLVPSPMSAPAPAARSASGSGMTRGQPQPEGWESVQRLADKGALVEAQRQCERLLELDSTCAEGHLLYGHVLQAMGHQAESETAFRRAVFLDPNCGEALLQLALGAERRGSITEAQRFRERLKRVPPQGVSSFPTTEN